MEAGMDVVELFHRLDKHGIEEYVRLRQQEDLHLDFKRVNNDELKKHEDTRNLLRALSGFANSDGGLVIWGVDARKVNGVDCARELALVEDAARLVSRLQELTGQFVTPTVEGVRHRAIPWDDGTQGVVVTVVPASDGGPHMALGGDNRYYCRSGGSFMKMEHFQVADMFGRRRRPCLELRGAVDTGMRSSNGVQWNVEAVVTLSIENSGRGLARYLFARLRVHDPYHLSSFGLENRVEGLRRVPRVARSAGSEFAGDSNIAVHPGTGLQLTTVRRTIPPDTEAIEDVVVDWELAAEGAPLTSGVLTISGADILDCVRPKWGAPL
jgi:hypothetical protein